MNTITNAARFNVKALRLRLVSLLALICPLPLSGAEVEPIIPIVQSEAPNALQIQALDINVEIFDTRAISHALYTIKNNTDEDIEATVAIPLPADAQVVGYALDISGAMISGVAVPKAKARETFEDIEDREVDPGIAEVTRGNSFSTEIYPVPANGQRKVRVSYTHALARSFVGAYVYHYPLSRINGNAAISITISADGMRMPPSVKKSPFTKPEWVQANTGNRFYFADALSNNYKGERVLENLDIHFAPHKQSKAVIARAIDNKRYVLANLDLDEKLLEPVNTPNKISVLWDASASAKASHKNNLKLLSGLIKNLRRLKNEAIRVQLVVFSNEILVNESYSLEGKEYALLLEKLITLRYDGATRFDLPQQAAAAFEPDYAVLFSDGISSLGDLSPIDIGKPVYVISNNEKRNLPWLYHTAYKQGGLLLNVDEIGLVPTLKMIGKTLPELELRVNGAATKFNLQTWVDIGERISVNLAAQLPEEFSVMDSGTLSFSAGDETLYVAPFQQQAVGDFARYDWLRLRLNNLLGDEKANQNLITQLGMDYGLATPFTSLIVLESLDDYVSYGIRPPAHFPEAARYDELREEWLADEGEGDTKQEILNFLKYEWGERVAWWEHASPITVDEAKQLLSANKKQVLEEEVMVQGLRASLHNEAAFTQIEPWAPSTPYMDRITAGDPKGKKSNYDLYFDERETYGRSPAFYMAVAQYFFRLGEREKAIRIMSNIVELHPESAPLERMLAYNFVQFGEYAAAIAVLEHVKKIKPWEAVSARDLANVWEKQALASGNTQDLRKAIDYYVEAVTGPWDIDDNLRIVALMELNRLIAKLQSGDTRILELKAELLKNIDLDIRIVLSWNSRDADIDLWVKEPSGELVGYSNDLSVAGGSLPYDFIDGFGPEEYLSRYALDGKYEIFVDFYAENSVELFGPVTLTIDIYTHYGRENEKLTTSTVQLKSAGERIPVGAVTWH